MIKAILFDLDGVLVDMVQGHYISLNKALKDICGFELTHEEHFKELNGLPTKKKLEKLTHEGRVNINDHQKIFDLKQHYTKEVINEIITIDNSKIELFEYIKSLKLKSACVTNSIRDTATLMLKNAGILSYLEFIICNEDTIPKPSAQGYIKTIDRLNIKPKECIIVEDSDHGIRAAINSGSNLWKVKNSEEVIINNFKKTYEKFNNK